VEDAGGAPVPPGLPDARIPCGAPPRYIGPARLFLVSSLVLFAALRFATESLEIESVMIGDPQPTPKAQVESGGILTLDDDLNFKLADLPEARGLLSKPIARFNSLTRAQKLEQILQGTLRYGPYAMFVLLPAFALLLKLLYLGRRRRHPARPRLYGEHLVFAAHNTRCCSPSGRCWSSFRRLCAPGRRAVGPRLSDLVDARGIRRVVVGNRGARRRARRRALGPVRFVTVAC